jgi:signal transduction histidine kinase
MEVQLRQAQKLESIGQLAAGIAHEINTPIQYIGDNARFLKDAFQDFITLLDRYDQLLKLAELQNVPREVVEKLAQEIRAVDTGYLLQEIPNAIQQSLEGVERVSTLVAAMKEFSHPGTKEKTPLDLNKAIESTLTVARNEWKYIAEMETDYDPTLPRISCLPGEFNQVILNLVVNAAHAIAEATGDGSKGKGTITICTRDHADWVEIQIGDSGSGIPLAARARIFEPFFTTKEVDRGTGQGLAIAYSVIVEKHGGNISFETEIGKGTTFTSRLPHDGKALPSRTVVA